MLYEAEPHSTHGVFLDMFTDVLAAAVVLACCCCCCCCGIEADCWVIIGLRNPVDPVLHDQVCWAQLLRGAAAQWRGTAAGTSWTGLQELGPAGEVG